MKEKVGDLKRDLKSGVYLYNIIEPCFSTGCID